MGIAYALSTLWAAGCIVAPLVGTYYLWEDDGWWMAALCFSIGLPIGVVMALLPWAFIADSKSPDLATLKKGQWACTASHDETTMILVGKVMVPQRRTVCDAYSRTR